MADRPEKVEFLRGRVVRGVYAKGSKSERHALYLETAEQRYVLRRKGGPVFSDAELARLVGQEIECEGFSIGTTLLAEKIKVVK